MDLSVFVSAEGYFVAVGLLLFALARKDKAGVAVEIGEERIGAAVGFDLGYEHLAAVGQKHIVYGRAAYHENFTRSPFYCVEKLALAAYYGAVGAFGQGFGEHDIHPVFQGIAAREGTQGVAAHDHRVARGGLFEKFHVGGQAEH